MKKAARVQVIASTVGDCLEIEKGGAHRIELVSALQVGGLTPSYGLIRRAKQATSLPINVMIRPHSLNFQYTEDDLAVMLQDIDCCKSLKVNGVVFGVLTDDQRVDVQKIKRLVEEANGLEITFHKAFDQTTDLLTSSATLNEFKQINRVLTQGGITPILDNIGLLQQLVVSTTKTILIGGGLRHSNFPEIKKLLPACEYHFGTAVRTHDKVSSGLVNDIIQLCSQ